MAVPRTILVAIDLDPLSRQALGRAAERARLFGATLRVLHVYDRAAPSAPIPIPGAAGLQREAQRALAAEVARNVDSFLPKDLLEGVDHEVELVCHPSPGEAVSERAAKGDVDLLVVGSHHRTGLGRVLLGSVAEKIVRSAPCDVLVVRASTES